MEDILGDGKKDNHLEAHEQTREAVTPRNDDCEDSAPVKADEQVHSSDAENDSEEYYIPDNKSQASLEFSDGERKYSLGQCRDGL